MKKIFFLLSIIFICFASSAQTKNSKGTLKRGVLTFNNGKTLTKGDKITLSSTKNNSDRFTHVYGQKHLFGIMGGEGAPKEQQYKMFVIHYIDAVKDKKNGKEKKFIAAIGLGEQNSLWLCDIVEAIESGEVFISGISPEIVQPNISEVKENAQTKENIVIDVVKKKEESTITENLPQKETTTNSSTLTSENNLLQKINELQKSKEITNSEHYQLLKIITGSNDNIDDKKELIKKLQTLRNDKKITLEEYDKIVDLMI